MVTGNGLIDKIYYKCLPELCVFTAVCRLDIVSFSTGNIGCSVEEGPG